MQLFRSDDHLGIRRGHIRVPGEGRLVTHLANQPTLGNTNRLGEALLEFLPKLAGYLVSTAARLAVGIAWD